MKLHEIKEIGKEMVSLNEGVIPIHITMTLDQIINAGQITNSVQTFVLAGLVEMFKDGGPYRWPRELNSYGMSTMSTSSDMIEAVKSLNPSDHVQIATWLQGRLASVAGFESNPYPNQPVDPVQYMRQMIQQQDD